MGITYSSDSEREFEKPVDAVTCTMSGIWALFGMGEEPLGRCEPSFERIAHRGPDAWRVEGDSRAPGACLGFRRLSVVDSMHGMQPMRIHAYPKVTLMCNGEIYNWKQLKEEYGFPYETNCDVEIIIHLFKTFGIERTVKSLDGVFSFVIVDLDEKKITMARDPYGVRPMFTLTNKDQGALAACSEAKGLVGLKNLIKGGNSQIAQFAPGHYETWQLHNDGKVTFGETKKYFEPGMTPTCSPGVQVDRLKGAAPSHAVALLLEEAVHKRLMSDRRVGCLLSGGLNSSLIAALTMKLASKVPMKYHIQTFAIGMKGSPDLVAARKVANHIGSQHHEVIFTEDDIRANLDEVITSLESFDIATVRASIPMYILSKYIQDKTDTTVLLSGEGADEVAQGYIHFRDAPTPQAAHDESVRLLRDIHLFDVLRADRMISAASLELRCPFLDLQFTSYFLKLPEEARKPQKGYEKHLLRSSFSKSGLLPEEILWRHKEVFSDGVTSIDRTMYSILTEECEARLRKRPVDAKSFKGLQTRGAESTYYRSVFERAYPGQQNFTPYYWMPTWVDAKDPSARFLKHYARA